MGARDISEFSGKEEIALISWAVVSNNHLINAKWVKVPTHQQWERSFFRRVLASWD
jgi:hypothetical protein